MQKGFTLIEVIIYIALFSLLMGSAFVTAFQIIDGSGKMSIKNTIQEEGNFVLRKLDWALTGISNFTNTTDTLHINRYDGNVIDIKLEGTKIKMTESIGLDDFITTDNVLVSSLSFSPITGNPQGATATFIITKDGVDFPFTITKYIRK